MSFRYEPTRRQTKQAAVPAGCRHPQAHGSMPYGELRHLGIDPALVNDFSATVNPFPLPDKVRRAFSADGIAPYPDPDCYDATTALATFHDILPERLVLTAGMTEPIFLFPRLYPNAAQFAPTYGDYARAYRGHGSDIANIAFPSSDKELRGAIDIVRSRGYELVIICNPNNPDGAYVPPEGVRELCATLPAVTICVDESYQEMGARCDTAIALATQSPNLLVLKSLTKPYGIGGVRVAYAVGAGEAVERIRNHLLPWGVSSIAQRIVPQIIRTHAHFECQWANLHAESTRLLGALDGIGIEARRGRCPFLLAHVDNATAFRQRMLREHHMALRDCTSFGMPDQVRIMPSTPDNNDRLLIALGKQYG